MSFYVKNSSGEERSNEEIVPSQDLSAAEPLLYRKRSGILLLQFPLFLPCGGGLYG